MVATKDIKRLLGLSLLLGFLGQGFGASAPVASPASATPPPAPHQARLSWAPYDYLSKGFRNAPWIHDPFFPEPSRFHVTGIVSDEMAYINGKWFHIGEKMDGYLIKAITAKGVTLSRPGEVLQLKIAEP